MIVDIRVHLFLMGSILYLTSGQYVAQDTNGNTLGVASLSNRNSGTGTSNSQQQTEGAGDGDGGREGSIGSTVTGSRGRSGVVDPMVRLQNVHTVDDFISLLQTEDGEQLMPSNIFSEHRSTDGKRVIYTGGRMAEPDDCSPRNTTVRIHINSTDSQDIFFPTCTRVERCGGCCPSKHLKCVPFYTERLSLMVIKARASRPGSAHLVYSGIAPVVVDRHIQCVLRCDLDQAKCGAKKRFLSNQCICRCRRYKRCRAPQVFDSNTCSCKCPTRPRDCCRSVPNCGLVFNQRACRCLPDTGRVHMSSRNFTMGNDTGVASSTTTPTTETSQTDEEPAVGRASAFLNNPVVLCAAVQCPTSFDLVVDNGDCRCRPSRHFARPRIRTNRREPGRDAN